MKKLFRLVTLFVFCGAGGALFAGSLPPASAITWVPQEFTCPIDKEKNTFLVVASYGSYIYQYPSKYQWLFFPQTATPTYYICKKCHLTTYMWDFDKLPPEKLPEIKKTLEGVKISKAFKQYTELPVSERLDIMEKIYPVLGKDDEWWESFYRVKGYHYAKEGKTEKAGEARRKSLSMIQKEIGKPESDSPQKILLYISAAMKHFLGDDQAALEDLQKALATKYQEKGKTDQEIKNAEEGLNQRIQDYVEKIKSDKQKPRLFDKSDGDADSHDDH